MSPASALCHRKNLVNNLTYVVIAEKYLGSGEGLQAIGRRIEKSIKPFEKLSSPSFLLFVHSFHEIHRPIFFSSIFFSFSFFETDTKVSANLVLNLDELVSLLSDFRGTGLFSQFSSKNH